MSRRPAVNYGRRLTDLPANAPLVHILDEAERAAWEARGVAALRRPKHQRAPQLTDLADIDPGPTRRDLGQR